MSRPRVAALLAAVLGGAMLATPPAAAASPDAANPNAASPDANPDPRAAQGDAHWRQGHTAEALVAWSEALAQARQEGDAAAEVALGLRVAAVLRELGRTTTADQLLRQLEAAAPTPVHQAQVAIARGQWQLAMGQLKPAARGLEAAFRQAQQAEAPAVALNAAIALGEARRAQGDRAGARKAWAAATTLAGALGDRVAQGDVAQRIAGLDRQEGDLARARQGLEAAVLAYRAAGELAGEADAQAALALVLADLGHLDDARALLAASLDTARARRDLPRQAGLLAADAGLALRQGRTAGARERYLAALDAFRSAGLDGPAAGVALDLALLDDDPAAIEAALDLARQAGDRPRQARAALDLALALEGTRPKDAARHAAAALDIADDLAMSGVRWRALAVLGRLDLAAGRAEPGIRQLEAAVAELERTRLGLSPDDARGFARAAVPVYTALVDALLARDDARHQDRVRAFVYAQRLQLSELPPPGGAPSGAAAATGQSAEGQSAAARYQALVAEEAFLAAALNQGQGEGQAKGAAEPEAAARADALRARLAELRVEFAAAVDQLRAQHDDLDALVGLRPEELEAVQAELEPGVVVLQPVLLPDQVALMVVRRDSLAVRMAPRAAGELEGALTTLRTAVHMPGMLDPRKVHAAAELLGQRLLVPVLPDLAGAELLVVARSGILRQLPFAMLRHDGRWLVEDLPVVSVTDVGALRGRSASRPRPRLSGAGLLLVGNPDGSLPGAEAEVRAIAEKLPGATVMVGAAGTQEALLQRATGKSALHLATHGWIDPGLPTASHLVLAPSQADPEGRLDYGEIPGLGPYLDAAHLVVLSACDSALPVDAHGRTTAEGQPVVSIAGMAAQFRRAGVDSMVASLWQVDDEGTRLLMEGMYAELAQGSSLADALHRAQLSLLAQPAWEDPFFWAAFEVVGDWR